MDSVIAAFDAAAALTAEGDTDADTGSEGRKLSSLAEDEDGISQHSGGENDSLIIIKIANPTNGTTTPIPSPNNTLSYFSQLLT